MGGEGALFTTWDQTSDCPPPRSRDDGNKAQDMRPRPAANDIRSRMVLGFVYSPAQARYSRSSCLCRSRAGGRRPEERVPVHAA